MLAANDILVTKGITKSFGGLVALNGVDLAVREKSLTMLIGPNGSGKSTLLNIISGFYKPDKGKVWFNGREITNWPPYKIFDFGVVRTFQIPQPFVRLTVLENMLAAYKGNPGESFIKALFKRTWIKYEKESIEKAFKILKVLDLDHMWDSRSDQLSGGQMKLLETGRALMCDAKMILMDEPLSGVNPSLADQILSYFRKIKERFGVTFLMVEHRLEIALKHVDYVYAMSRGRIISNGTPEEVLNDPVVIESYLGGEIA
ncbi:ABC transporter ATP-binding protein [Candidatus Geothermarchaeota archaeon]|nr:MAG: ABC transporter ATP-binding protein [Candidatus Geothermarchaeota archaeon]